LNKSCGLEEMLILGLGEDFLWLGVWRLEVWLRSLRELMGDLDIGEMSSDIPRFLCGVPWVELLLLLLLRGVLSTGRMLIMACGLEAFWG